MLLIRGVTLRQSWRLMLFSVPILVYRARADVSRSRMAMKSELAKLVLLTKSKTNRS